MGSVITVRVPEELKDNLKKYNLEAAEIARRAWIEEIRKKKIEDAKAAAEKLGEYFSEIGIDQIKKWMEEDRRTR